MSGRIKPWLFLVLIFVAGGLTGSALTIGLASYFHQDPTAGQLKARWMRHLTQRLDLTTDQQGKIEPILNDAENQVQAARHDNADRITQIIQKTNAQIEQILTPEQKAKLEQMTKQMQMDRDRMFPGKKMRPWQRGPGGPPGPDGPEGMMPPPPPPDH